MRGDFIGSLIIMTVFGEEIGEEINITCNYIAVVYKQETFFIIKPRHATLCIATVYKEL